MKYKYVFLLGRPGCGKSAVYRELEKRILEGGQAKTFERVDDFPKLWAIFRADHARDREGKERIYTQRADDGDFFLTKDALNVALEEVSSDLVKIDKPDHMVFVEFARPSYVEAFQNFDRSVLEWCVAIYIEVSFDTCWARVVARSEAAIAEGGDDHWLPREAMERYYLYDDQDAFVQVMKDQGIPVLVVNNEADGEWHLKKQVEELFRNLF